MNILMLTNTYLPHVGGVARSVDAFAREYRRRGHAVLIVAPQFPKTPSEEEGVIRVPAIQNFNGSDFSVRLPVPSHLNKALRAFGPQIVHAHHPFLLGDTALRVAAELDLPLVFQHHTMYERYTHYVPGDSSTLKRFVIDLSTEYANLCDQVFAPSESVAAILRDRHVETPIEVLPTGVDVPRFAKGDGGRLRRELGIPDTAFVVGYLGRLSPEKNLEFLAEAVARFLRGRDDAHFLTVGDGRSRDEVRRIFDRYRLGDRLHLAGTRQGQDLVDAYHAMDVFAFASQSETQGMVLTEAMAAGLPVVGLDAPGVREVVEDQANGRQVPGEDPEQFAAGLRSIADLDSQQYQRYSDTARRTADRFSMPVCAEKALNIYQGLIETRPGPALGARDWERRWQPILWRVQTEWELLSTRAQAAGKAVFGPSLLWRWPVVLLRRIRRLMSRSEWMVRLFGLSVSRGTAAEPGLIMIQIDGLGRDQFERALTHKRLPFLQRFLRREHYQLRTLYSGMPSTTPAVQGELFYGVSGAVPAFAFRDSQTGRRVRMYEPAAAAKLQKQLSLQGRGLLEEGAVYSDILAGSARESHYCPATAGWEKALRTLNWFSLFGAVVLHFWSAVRIVTLLGVETVLALVDFARGLIQGHHLVPELKFVPSRVAISVLLRELVTAGACVDAARGLPIVHLTFLGYDEQAHRRGPGSMFAHWSLKGIDDAIRRIATVAHRSARRDYQIWIYSDHGQESVVPYEELQGVSIHEAVAEAVLTQPGQQSAAAATRADGIQHSRSQWLGGGRLQRLLWWGRAPKSGISEDGLLIAMGPLGHVYPPEPLSMEQRDRAARQLVTDAGVPLVLSATEEGHARAWNVRGTFRLPEEAAEVLGASHPVRDLVAEDLVRLCHHPDAGELVISGWRPDGQLVTFPRERGAHGGPGMHETRGFALLPADAIPASEHGKVIRPLELRGAALKTLGRRPRTPRSPSEPGPEGATLRVVTYNVHSCVGVDGKLSPARIARVIAQWDPDVVALQELDVGRHRTHHVDQVEAIARELRMEHRFHPAFQVESEQYGNAVLSRYPMRVMEAGPLPKLPSRGTQEPRSALWVSLDVEGQQWQLINVHLGLSARERMAQVETLLGERWLDNPRCREPRLLCGDLNAGSTSRPHRKLATCLSDAQSRLARRRRLRTFPSRLALVRLDHVFVGSQVDVVNAEVLSSKLARVASDHLPLLVEVRVAKQAKDGNHRSVRDDKGA
ncbi:MAG: glycosyltransferase [Planctomycetota bacterium]